jgi:hypothetical protein
MPQVGTSIQGFLETWQKELPGQWRKDLLGTWLKSHPAPTESVENCILNVVLFNFIDIL